MTKPMDLSDTNFETEVLQSDKPVLVDFWAPWCGPCRMVGPVVEELAGEYEGRLKVAKVNTDENQARASQLGIRGIPTLIFFKDGREVDRVVGALPKPALKARVDDVLGA
ncbi:MAG TPA: thioredoxin [Thermoanaerobaculia bacterium]|nr:thioredoxin [Thermoanaerobaculia bacterium]